MPVDPLFAEWLQAPALYERATDATATTRWGELARDVTLQSGLALKADAATEAARHLAYLAQPLAEEVHVIAGAHRDKLGSVVTITGTDLGYDAGLAVFVIGAAEDSNTGLTTLTVLRRL